MRCFALLLLGLGFLSGCTTETAATDAEATDLASADIVATEAVPADVISGVYQSGFEASVLKPCSAPEAQWWVTPNQVFSEQYQTFLPPDSGRVAFMDRPVFVRVRGDLTETGELGHLGAYSRELTITELVEMTGVDSEPEDNPLGWIRSICVERGS